jgi:hypothetical protein
MTSTTTRKRKAADAGLDGAVDPKLQLVQSITALRKSQEGFKAAVDSSKSLIDDIFTGLDIKINAKQRESQDIAVDVENTKKQRKIEMEQQLQELGHAAVKKILEDRKEIAVSAESYEMLKNNYEELKLSKRDDIDAAISAERSSHAAEIKAMKRNQELEHQAIIAKASAQNEQQREQIKVLEATIASLKSDMEAQRQLTRQVAEAASRAPSMMYDSRPADSGGRRKD